MLSVRMKGAVSRLTFLAAVVVFSGACNSGDRDRAAAEADSALGRATEAVGAAADTVAGRVAGREYTNAELVALLNTYNDAEVEIGTMAQTKATDPQVRQFARRLVTEHRALKTEVTAAAQRLNITPAMPSDDEDLVEDHQEGMRDLNAKARGREFDEDFLEHQIGMHKKVLDEIEDALGRNRNPELRSLLEQARTGIRGHLTTAEELEKKFGAV